MLRSVRFGLVAFSLASVVVALDLAACSGDSANAVGAAAAPDGSSPVPDSSAAVDGSSPEDAGVVPDAARPSGGCGGAAGYAIGTTITSITVGGRERSFRVHVPPGYDKNTPTPAVILLHGGGGSAQQLENGSSNMDPIADREGFVTVYPDGTGVIKTWNAGNCCGKAVADGIDDVAFVGALLDDLEAKLCIDARRVFATGMSNGAIMDHRLACELADRFAAIAPVSGTIGVPSCSPTSKVAVMEIHGTGDAHVPWDGGVGCGASDTTFASVPSTLEGWRTRNGCGAATAPYFQQGNGSCSAYQGCQAPVVLCTIDGGGHSWPGGDPKADAGAGCPGDGPQSESFIASEAMWSFFKANPKPL